METRPSRLSAISDYERRGELGRAAKVAISGSFNRHLDEIGQAIEAFTFRGGVEVLSPQDNQVVDRLEEFVFLDSDRRRSVKGVQTRHFAAIKEADLLYVVCPDGYTGSSVCLEIGCAIACRTPILASARPEDMTVRQYVDQIVTPAEAVDWVANRPVRTDSDINLLLEPERATDLIHAVIEEIRQDLTTDHYRGEDDQTEELLRIVRRILHSPPGHS